MRDALYGRNDAFVRPSFVGAQQNGAVLHTGLARHFGNRRPRSVWLRYQVVVSDVVHLLSRICPAAIARLVMSIGVYSVDAVRAAWRSSHVSKKVAVICQPPIAHANPAPSIDAVLLVGRPVAPGLHSEPRLVFLGFPVALTMSALGLSGLFDRKAAAALAVPRLKRASVDNGFIAAFAAALPSKETSTC